MIRKSAVAVTAAAALALGTASATSLGNFDSPTFAASDTSLLDCEVTTTPDLLSLLPDIPTVGDDLTTLVGDTLEIASLDVTPLRDAIEAIDVACVTDTVLDLVLVDASGTALDVISGITLEPAATSPTLTPEVPTVAVDVATVDSVRAVVRDA